MSTAAIALNRFGLGARPDEPIPDEPRVWLAAQFSRFDAAPPALAEVPSRAELAGELAEMVQDVRGMRRGRRRMADDANPAGESTTDDAMPDAEKKVRKFIRTTQREAYLASAGARANAALTTAAPFVERLVHFWANHFAVSADKAAVIGMAGLLEFEAIRPHVLGRFGEMLLAVERHPAMLLYLDQARSIGPNSRLGAFAERRGKPEVGLNENLAREILELHTLGVRTGYDQEDVTELARALTGWTIGGMGRGRVARLLGGSPGDFLFAEPLHEPGPRTVMGRRYDQQGEAQARAILSHLAVHEATAKHIATKLARHFVSDAPPRGVVDRLTIAFLDSGGDLPTVYRALIDSPEAWQPGPAKFKTPWDWSISALRGMGLEAVPDQAVAGLLNQLGQPVWRPGSPAGYGDTASIWAGPDALVRRVEAAERMATRTGGFDPRQLAEKLLPGALTKTTAQAIARADSPGQGLALLLVAPEFLRR